MMSTLTTRQRDILRIILEGNKPMSSSELAGLLNLTSRQVNYSIQGVKVWLNQHHQDLKTLPGAGFSVEIQSEEARKLSLEMASSARVQIVLSVSQRQQLLALFLLSQVEPLIVSQLEQKAQVSRMTITKDLDEIEIWLKSRVIILLRKPHFGIQASGAEQNIQQALAEVLWGETPFSSDQIVQISHSDGLVFTLDGDARLMPLVDWTKDLLDQLDLRRTIGLVAKAEEQLGGRFTDDAVLYLALAFAISARRVQGKHHFDVSETQRQWLETLPIWPVAGYIARRLGRDINVVWKPGDVAWLAMQMMAAPRNEILPGEIERYADFAILTDRLLEYTSQAFGIGKLKYDQTLQNGLLTHIVPAYYRERFQIWFPVALTNPNLSEQDERETTIANEIARMVFDHTQITLPRSEVENIVALLRAAIIRNRTYKYERIIIVCPSGMATAQLLVARLNARFPYLNKVEVTSLRDLTPALVSAADLILTTVPLPRPYAGNPKVILVHPLLMPADIEAITRYLS
jgi:mannitol operon transcriptional antiterminator